MKKTSILSGILLMLSVFTQAQSEKYSQYLSHQLQEKGMENTYKVWIFFTDKGGNRQQKLAEAYKHISKRSLARRKKLLKNQPLVTDYDIPVVEEYKQAVFPYLIKMRHESSWLNAISARVSGENIPKIAALDFVKKIDIVRTRKYTHNLQTSRIQKESNAGKSTKYNLDYGPSLTQLEQINVPLVHDMGYTGNGLIICVLDAGFNNLEHEVFDNMNIIDSYDFVNDDDNVDDENDMGTGNHGTMTLSTIGGFHEGDLIGPAYGASYLLAKTENTDSETQVEEDNWVAGAQWAENLGADITSTSLGYIDFDDGTGYDAEDLDGNTATITIAADAMAALGVLVVNSAGNSGPGPTTIGAPADGNEVLAVGAVDASGTITSFSSMGPTGDGRIKPDVMAMGLDVTVADTSGNYYTTASGTSFSCPLTAGAGALLWEMVPEANNMQIFEALKMTASNAATPNNQYGWGIIDVYAAYRYFFPRISTTPLSNTEDYNGPYEVQANISSFTDLSGGFPKLYYRVNGGDWNEIIMTDNGNDMYSASIPGTGSEANYDYYITAQNEVGLSSAPDNAPTNFYSFTATHAPEIIHNPYVEYYKGFWDQAHLIMQLNDIDGIDTDNSYVAWKINGETQSQIGLEHMYGNTYRADFPGVSLNINDIISYQIIAQDASSEHNIAMAPHDGYYEFVIKDNIGFENNAFIYNWSFNGDSDWFITDTGAQQGNYAAQSGDIGNNQSTSLSLSFYSASEGEVSFYRKVDSEPTFDFLHFYIDGIEKDAWSGDLSWSFESYTVPEGNHTLQWKYVKDSSVSDGEDAAWIDTIKLPENSTMDIPENNIAGLNLYPNPAGETVFLTFDTAQTQMLHVAIYDMTGKRVLQTQVHKPYEKIPVTTLKNGIYLVKINSDSKARSIRKLMISRK